MLSNLGQEIDQERYLLDSALTGPIIFLPWSAGVMSHFEKELYADELPPDRLNARWWEMVARYQGRGVPSALRKAPLSMFAESSSSSRIRAAVSFGVATGARRR